MGIMPKASWVDIVVCQLGKPSETRRVPVEWEDRNNPLFQMAVINGQDGFPVKVRMEACQHCPLCGVVVSISTLIDGHCPLCEYSPNRRLQRALGRFLAASSHVFGTRADQTPLEKVRHSMPELITLLQELGVEIPDDEG